MYKYFLIFLIPIFAKANDSTGSFTMQNAIDYAIKNNYDHKNQVLDNAIMYERVKEIVTTGMPQIGGSIGYRNSFKQPTSVIPAGTFGPGTPSTAVSFGTTNNLDVNLQLNQLIFDGRYLVGLQARKMMKEVSEKQVKMSEKNVADLIKKSYVTVLMTNESVKSISQNRAILEKLLDNTKKVYKEGLIEELDVDRLQLALANLNKEINKLENQNELALTALKFNMGFPIDGALVLADSLETYFAEATTFVPNNNFDIKKRPEYDLMQSGLILKGYDVKQQKAGAIPSLVGYVNTGTNAQRTSFNFTNDGKWYYYGSFGINLIVPIYDGGGKSYRLAQTKLGIEKAKNDIAKFELGTKLQVFQAQINYINAMKDLNNQMENVTLSQKINKKAKIMFKEGVGSSFELANSEAEMVKAQLNLLQSKFSMIISKLDYDKAVGN
jgi:outer membrane protein